MSRYIDADLLKQSIPNTKMDEFENCRYCMLLDEEQVKDLIDQQPAADVRENVRAHWIIEPYYNGLFLHRCSNCMEVSGIGGEQWPYRYCQHCGADMRGEA